MTLSVTRNPRNLQKNCSAYQYQIDDYFDFPEVTSLLNDLGKSRLFCTLLKKAVLLEWEQFDLVKSIDGRAACQDDARSFFIYRTAQYVAFPEVLLDGAVEALEHAQQNGKNLIAEKYARMMCLSSPEEYKRMVCGNLDQPSQVKKQVLDEIYQILKEQLLLAKQTLPVTHHHARPDTTLTNHISSLDYFIAELVPFRLGSLFSLVDALSDMTKRGHNPIVRTYIFTMRVMQAVEGRLSNEL
ncbi:MAG: DUF4125 family protein [Atopobium sp.]|uniref:DUF4125 family protein n=1 Tax=Atopobium sp. TaxID=1872650 RepID=UPI002A7FD02C|nr:DUF4125 family protein [Atopobium sp.]MDY4523300.1 DUF4125 family protein [Atopobium sp.]